MKKGGGLAIVTCRKGLKPMKQETQLLGVIIGTLKFGKIL